MRSLLAAIILGSVLSLGALEARACPMCKDSIADTAKTGTPSGRGTDQGGIPTGFNHSVYIMLGGVFVTGALVVGVIAKGIRGSSVTSNGFTPVLPPTRK